MSGVPQFIAAFPRHSFIKQPKKVYKQLGGLHAYCLGFELGPLDLLPGMLTTKPLIFHFVFTAMIVFYPLLY